MPPGRVAFGWTRVAVAVVACGACLACGGGTAAVDASEDAATALDAPTDAAAVIGTVTGVQDLPSCPAGAPAATTCRRATVTGCPGIEAEPLDVTLAIRPAVGTVKGTIVHFSGGGGTGYQTDGAVAYANAGFLQVFVAWAGPWEQTAGAGLGAAGCRPATVLRWIFDEPTLHAGSRTRAYCGEGFSGGSGQLAYALAHHGLADYLDYVNELSGPPFARVDLGCDGDAPATAVVCGATVTMRLPGVLTGWENMPPPLACGSTGVSAAELGRWHADSVVAAGGVYDYPRTRVEFFDCTNQATAVTAMAQLDHDAILAAEGSAARVLFHCYAQSDGCQGEGLGTGSQDAVAAMIAGCVPRHP